MYISYHFRPQSIVAKSGPPRLRNQSSCSSDCSFIEFDRGDVDDEVDEDDDVEEEDEDSSEDDDDDDEFDSDSDWDDVDEGSCGRCIDLSDFDDLVSIAHTRGFFVVSKWVPILKKMFFDEIAIVAHVCPINSAGAASISAELAEYIYIWTTLEKLGL